ncbi:dipeptidase [uncultured Cohaesibacter sp.]|uniref:dipeptidase n=1 Tax=uncultured Cohaesibacter sp. TaxID=1002546 RepID=UPI00292E78F0|nr:dipeptidase [uncultured Cohaesibacter sp.]
MTNTTSPLIFDGHNDFLLRFFRKTLTIDAAMNGVETGQMDFPRARAGGFGGGFFALYVPTDLGGAIAGSYEDKMDQPTYDIPLPPGIAWDDAIKVILSEVATFKKLEKAGFLTGCTSTGEIEAAFERGEIAAILHMEGAEAIDENFETLEVLYAAGLRSIGPVWSRPTIFGHGVPFRYPSTGDTGPGLTDLGKKLVSECNRLGVMLDVSHLNEKGFDDLAAITDAPIVATHSNAYAICPHARNLTDRQLSIIAESDGMVGLNFAVVFLRPDGQQNVDTSIDTMLRHLDHLIDKLGEDRVGLGSDFDGAEIPQGIKDLSGLPALREAMRQHGYGEELMTRLCHGNWMRVLKKTWKEI